MSVNISSSPGIESKNSFFQGNKRIRYISVSDGVREEAYNTFEKLRDESRIQDILLPIWPGHTEKVSKAISEVFSSPFLRNIEKISYRSIFLGRVFLRTDSSIGLILLNCL